MEDTKYVFKLEADEAGRVYAIKYRCCTVPRTVQLLGRNLADIMVGDSECHIESIGSCLCIKSSEPEGSNLNVFAEQTGQSGLQKKGSLLACDRLDLFRAPTSASSCVYVSVCAKSLFELDSLDGEANDLWETQLEVAAEAFSSTD